MGNSLKDMGNSLKDMGNSLKDMGNSLKDMGNISQYVTMTNDTKLWTVCIIHGIYFTCIKPLI